MVTPNRPLQAQGWRAQHSPLRSLKEFANLAHRFQEGESFRLYVRKRLRLVIPLGLVVCATAVACALAVVVFLTGLRSYLALPGLVLAPFVLLGSLLVESYVLFSWLEGRALARAYGKRTAPWVGIPPIPWVLAVAFVLLPLAMLLSVAPKAALFLIALHILGPVMFTRLDR